VDAASIEPIYAELTGGYRAFLTAEELVYRAAELQPGLAPTRDEVAADAPRPLKEKRQVERPQGTFLSRVLAHPVAGAHLVHAMLRPTEAARQRLDAFRREGALDLGGARVERRGNVGVVSLQNPRFLNAEDDLTLGPLETAIDLVLLDPAIEVGVLRGGPVEHPRYAGRRVFNAGINLTHLYHGRISFLFYLTRDLGLVNKLYRGLEGDAFDPEAPEAPEATLEKPWIGAVESFAIGGGCQLLLVLDHVLAEAGAFLSLPARKEGIVPGAANLRLPRFVGDRLARQAIMLDRRFEVDSPEGRLLCDQVVPAGGMDEAIERAAALLTGSSVVSAASNRAALRVGQEPRALFQRYMALYAREQAGCHFSPALVRNLEESWRAHERRP
jgi:enoyl-CoA hydratase/carnithine racemase